MFSLPVRTSPQVHAFSNRSTDGYAHPETHPYPQVSAARSHFFHFSLRLLVTTLTLLRAIAAPAIMGLSRKPFTG